MKNKIIARLILVVIGLAIIGTFIYYIYNISYAAYVKYGYLGLLITIVGIAISFLIFNLLARVISWSIDVLSKNRNG